MEPSVTKTTSFLSVSNQSSTQDETNPLLNDSDPDIKEIALPRFQTELNKSESGIFSPKSYIPRSALRLKDIHVGKFLFYLNKTLERVEQVKDTAQFIILGKEGSGKTTLKDYLNGSLFLEWKGILFQKENESQSVKSEEKKKPFFEESSFFESLGYLIFPEQDLAIKAGLQALFSYKNAPSILVVLDLNDLAEARLGNLRKICDELNEIQLSNNGVQPPPICFILTKKSSLHPDTLASYERDFLEKIKQLSSVAIKEEDESLLNILYLMKNSPIYIADYTTPTLRENLAIKLKQWISEREVLPPFCLQEQVAKKIQLFVNECFKKILTALEEKNYLESLEEGCKAKIKKYNSILFQKMSELKILQEGYCNLTSSQGGNSELIQKKFSELEEKIEKSTNKINDLSIPERSLVQLRKKLKNIKDELNTKNNNESSPLPEPFCVNDRRYSWIPFNFFRTTRVIPYKYPAIPTYTHKVFPNPLPSGDSFVVQKKNTPENGGTFQAIYQSQRGRDGNCTVTFYAPNKKIYRKEIIKLRKRKNHLKNLITIIETGIGQAEIKGELSSLKDLTKEDSQKSLQLQINLLKNVVDNTEGELNDLKYKKEILSLKMMRRNVLFEGNNINLLTKIFQIFNISSEYFEKYKTLIRKNH